ncbi:MAG TPA: arginine deiminase family protein, partial [Vicinamibacteria bacterium]|nr:arginine deiminase family protein [Vicinamibacteria bacterium]
AQGLRAVDRGAPTREGVQRELDAYVAALSAAGVAVEVLPALDTFPDSIFVEDPALVFEEGAILLRPGAPSRFGEADALAPTLRRRFASVLELTEGFVEGGDVLVTPDRVLIGLSERTSGPGAEALKVLLRQLGRRGEIVSTPPGVLHFKTDCSLLDEETILATPRLAAARAFERHRVILTPRGEEASANALRVNDRVFLGDRFPRTADRLTAAGYLVVTLPSAQIALLDAGFSCLSLRWNSGRGARAERP